MKLIVVAALALVAVVAAAPATKEGNAPVVQLLKSEFDQKPEGGYSFEWATDDGSQRQETGEVKEVTGEDDKPHTVVVVRGSYEYLSPETGEKVLITYTADENGFHPEGESIPKVARR